MIGRRTSIACVVGGLLLATLGVVLALDGHEPAVVGRIVPVVNIGRVPGLDGPSAIASAAHRQYAVGKSPVRARLRIAGHGVDARIRGVRLVGHELQIPRNPRSVGWWRSSAKPGDGQGTVVIVGHVNYAGVSGALSVLPSLRPGDAVSIDGPHRTVRYRVAAIRTYPKTTGIPDQVFARRGRPRLVLITCGGPFDTATGNYKDNIVAFAQPVHHAADR